MDGNNRTSPGVPQQPTQASWQYNAPGALHPAQAPQQPMAEHEAADTVAWTASEFIAHQKGIGWYAVLALAAVVSAAGIYAITKDRVTAGMILLAAILFGYFASHKPRVLAYRLDETGLTAGRRLYPYSGFKSFSVVDEGNFSNVVFLPLKRFAPSITVYYAPEDEDKILNVLSQYLPFAEHQPDAFDRFMHRIRF